MKSIFKQLMECESFREASKLAAHKGQRINAGPWEIELPGVPKAGEEVGPVTKYTTTTGDFPSERTAIVAAAQGRRVYVRDLVNTIGLDTPSLDYSRVVGWSASGGGVGEGAAKPESAFTTEVVVDKVETIATHMPYSRRALVSHVGVAAFIQNVMGFFLSLAEDEAILNNNTANFKGILNVPGIQTQAVGAEASPLQPKLIAIRKAIGKVRTGITGAGVNAGVGFEPTALLVHPSDGEELELLTDSAGGYVLVPAIAAPWWEPLQAQFWRVPVVETTAMPAGTGLLGAWDVGVTLWPYGPAEVSISDSHSDLFVKNLVEIRVEVRELLATYVPKAFCKITGL